MIEIHPYCAISILTLCSEDIASAYFMRLLLLSMYLYESGQPLCSLRTGLSTHQIPLHRSQLEAKSYSRDPLPQGPAHLC